MKTLPRSWSQVKVYVNTLNITLYAITLHLAQGCPKSPIFDEVQRNIAHPILDTKARHAKAHRIDPRIFLLESAETLRPGVLFGLDLDGEYPTFILNSLNSHVFPTWRASFSINKGLISAHLSIRQTFPSGIYPLDLFKNKLHPYHRVNWQK